MNKVWEKIIEIADTSLFKPITYIEDNGELICNPDEITDTFGVRYAGVSSTESTFSISSQEKMRSNATLTSNVKGTGLIMCLSR